MLTGVLDFLWPRHCAVAECLRPIGRGGGDGGGPFVCGECLARLPFDRGGGNNPRVRAVFVYKDAVRQLIRDFKFNGRRYLGGFFCDMMARTFAAQHKSEELKNILLVPVPLHPMRLRERRFNQSDDLARGMARRLGLTVADRALFRVRDTAHQARSARTERLVNLENAFEIPDPKLVAGRRVVLVDDVTTTGTTFATCAAPIVAAGAEEVTLFALARTMLDTEVS